MEWSTSKVLDLINLYKKYPLLWDQNHKSYRDRNKRKASYKEMGKQLNLPWEEVDSKINRLRSQYNREMVKVLDSKGKGANAQSNSNETVYTPRWFAFELMEQFMDGSVPKKTYEFLKDLEQSKMPTISIQNEMNDRSSSHSLDIPERPIASIEKKKKRKKPPVHQEEFNRKNQKVLATIPNIYNNEPDEDTEFMKALKSINEDFQQSRDEYALFGEHVSYQIRKLNNPRLQALAKHRISTVLYEVELKGIDEQNYTDPMQMK